ncbi:Holliday junction branch migration protein RuvA [Nitrincola tapanii]|uniref:Holliday junction branch migration complex subunit RuvA n=1 Tax=Nitrincola tapanii TaxID=1708751 RepID=A0A5A9W3C7_9GAMM|nr:Holliday junction branch migration protein RuvA [Nitrincola tapanii]KAA0875112.1 Holliday junction branch migration protein RuvA [Nitrincola tapanii]
MIGHLRGRLLEKQPPFLLLEAAGVGYEVEASMNACYRLPEVGQEVALYTHLVVREDAQLLYGFADRAERTLFRELIKTNGVGPKLALTILSGTSGEAFIRCVEQEDVATLVKLPGVGKKTAERLIIEMKDRLKPLMSVPSLPVSGLFAAAPAVSEEWIQDAVSEAESALLALGYKPVQATRAVSQAQKQLGEEASVEALIRQSLKSMIS